MTFKDRPGLSIPAPFDNLVAAVALGSDSNRVADYIDVSATLNHGRNTVRVALEEGGCLEIDCRLKQSIVKLSWVNCRLVPSNHKEKILTGDFERIQREYSSGTKRAAGGKAGGGVEKPTEFLSWLSLSGKHFRESSREIGVSISAQSDRMQVHFAGNDTIAVQANLDGSFLSGVLLNFSHFGRFEPFDHSLPFMIAAEVFATEQWLFPLNPKPINVPEQYLRRWRTGLLNSRAKELHSEAFDALLAHLVASGLQRDSSTKYATLAVDALLAVPEVVEGEKTFGLAYLPQTSTENVLQVPMSSLLSVIEAEPEAVLELLRGSHVDEQVLKALQDRHFPKTEVANQSDADSFASNVPNASPSILVVEDEPAQLEVMAYNLEQEGYDVVRASSGESALLQLQENDIDLVLLDWMLPDISGIEICRRLKQDTKFSSLPIIMISARSEEVDRVRGLETGANDYISKPYSAVELLSRIRVQLRAHLSVPQTPSVRQYGDIVVDDGRQVATRGSDHLDLGGIEFRLLAALLARPGEAISYGELIMKAWGSSVAVNRGTLGIYVGRLRQSLTKFGGADPIRTVRNNGYAIFYNNHA